MNKKRKIIAVDIDDVLSASAEGFVDYTNQRWGHQLKPEDYQEEWAIVWGVSVEEAMRRSHEFHSSGVVAKYRHMDDAMRVLKNLAKSYTLIIVTSRRSILREETASWLDRYFPGIFGDIRYAGIWDSSAPVEHMIQQTKADVCRELNADYLIDDQLKHCTGAASVGLKALLFGEYRWNHSAELPAGITRVKDWKAVEEYFDEQG